MGKIKKFIAIIIFEITSDSNLDTIYDESIISIKGENLEDVKELVNKYIESNITTYTNAFNEKKKISLYKIVDISEQLRDNHKEGVLELYSRHFKDVASYLKFDNYTV